MMDELVAGTPKIEMPIEKKLNLFSYLEKKFDKLTIYSYNMANLR